MNTAPSTDFSASRLCGGVRCGPGFEVASSNTPPILSLRVFRVYEIRFSARLRSSLSLLPTESRSPQRQSDRRERVQERQRRGYAAPAPDLNRGGNVGG